MEHILPSEEVDEALEEIERKFSPVLHIKADVKNKIPFIEELRILSQDLDSLGIPIIELEQRPKYLLKQVIQSTMAVIQMHRRMLSHNMDTNISNNRKDAKIVELTKMIDNYKDQLAKDNLKFKMLENKINQLMNDIGELHDKEKQYKTDIKKLKDHSSWIQNKADHNVKRQDVEIQRLKEVCGEDIGRYTSKDEIIAQLLLKYKTNEETYKQTIRRLEDNNRELTSRVLALERKLNQ